MAGNDVVKWLLDSDPALRWQVERDLVHAPEEVLQATRARVATEGFGARLLALQDPDGQWAGGAYFPGGFDFAGPEATDDAGQPWTATTWTLNTLRDWGLDAAVLGDTAERLAVNSRWEYDNLPYWGGEVDACINAYTLANGAWLGADVSGLVTWFLEHRLTDGGWNCEWVEGSTVSSFHSTLNALKGLLFYEAVTGGTDAVRAARRSGGMPVNPRSGSRTPRPGCSSGGTLRIPAAERPRAARRRKTKRHAVGVCSRCMRQMLLLLVVSSWMLKALSRCALADSRQASSVGIWDDGPRPNYGATAGSR